MGLASNGLASPIPPTAKNLIDQAQLKASKEGKRVYVMFDGGQNEWARKHDAFLAKNTSFFKRSFVMVRLVPFQNADPKYTPNPGAVEYLSKWGGARAGLPFVAIISPQGDMIGNSMYPHDNTVTNLGHPWTDPEVDAYMKLIAKAAGKATKADLSRLKSNLLNQKDRGRQRVVI